MNERTYNTRVNKQLIIYNPHADVTWNVKYIPYNSLDGVELLVSSGTLVPEYDGSAFSGRIQLVHNGIEIDPVKSTDSGTYEFRDVQANLAQIVSVNVEPGEQQHILNMCSNSQLQMIKCTPSLFFCLYQRDSYISLYWCCYWSSRRDDNMLLLCEEVLL